MENKKKSWNERLAQLGPSRSGITQIMEESIATFLQGVSVLTGMKYPLWVLERFEKDYKGTPDMDMEFVVGYGANLSEDDEDMNIEGEVCGLLYHMLLEPFYFIEQKEKEDSEDGITDENTNDY